MMIHDVTDADQDESIEPVPPAREDPGTSSRSILEPTAPLTLADDATEALDDDRPTVAGGDEAGPPRESSVPIDRTQVATPGPGWTQADQPPTTPFTIPAASQAADPVTWDPQLPPPPEAIRAVGTGPPLLGRYIPMAELGRGGMGIVYDALDRERGRRIALKTLTKIDAASLTRFKREFRARADLVHPNLVPLYELVSEEDRWFFTMERVEGIDFLSYVRPPGEDGAPRLDPARLRESLRQLGLGLIAVHEAGLLHRDLKPSNVLVRPDGHVFILDFGLVAALQPLDGADTESRPGPPGPDSWHPATTDVYLVGTVAYIAPEVAAGQPPGPPGDWYSVGVMLYEALVGRRPFAGSPERVLANKQSLDPTSPAALVPGLPADLVALCEALLDRRPEARPKGYQVLESLGRCAAEATSRASDPARTVFIGRESPLSALRDAYQAARAGRPLTVLVHGCSGVGKTALLQRFLGSIRQDEGAVILAGRCFEQELVPYKAIDTLVDALAHHLTHMPDEEADALLPAEISALARIFPVLRRVPAIARASHEVLDLADRQEFRRRAFNAWRALLAAIAARRPLVLAIDDLQWGDRDSALLLAELLRPPDPPRLLLLASFRSEYADKNECLGTFLASLANDGGVDRRELEIGPLSLDEARNLALAAFGRGDPPARAVAEAIARESGGNPYFIDELVQYVRAGADLADLATPGRGIDLERALWSRIAALPDDSRRLLEVIALAGRPLAQRWAFRAAGVEGGEPATLVTLRSAKLVRSNGPRLDDEVEAFHDRIRESVVSRLDPDARRDRHRRLAEALESSGTTDPEVLAVHFIGMDRPEAAARYYVLAADRAAEALAFDRAARLYHLADTAWPQPGAPGRALCRKRADALANAGRGVEAAELYLAVASAADGAERAALQRRAAYQYCISGHIDEGRAAFREILARIGLALPRSPRQALLSLLARRGLLRLRGLRFRERPAAAITPEELDRIDTVWEVAIGLLMIDLIPSHDFLTRGLLLALRAGEPYRIVRSLALLAAQIATVGRPARRRALRMLDRADSIGRRLDHPHAQGMLALSRGIAEFIVGHWRTCLEAAERAKDIFMAECTGVAWEINTCCCFEMLSLAHLGEFDELRRRWTEGLRRTKERGDLYGQSVLDTQIGTQVRLADGDPDGARRELRAIMARWSRDGFHLQHIWELNSETLIDLYLGDGRAAFDRLRDRWPALKKSLFLRTQVVRDYLLYLRAISAVSAAKRARDPRPLLDVARRDVRRLRREGVPWASAVAELAGAGLHSASGNAEAALRGYAAAADALDTVAMPPYAAAARRQLGALLGGPRGRDLIAEAEADLARRGLREPSRASAMYTGSG
ncbi:MAG TPA: AAA family ATPase [Isosphaeraceae bacterium]|nr:AAA family ATPase [Isosphaeraceae bacterium]